MEKSVLIGTPTFEGKEYCLDFWAQRIKQIKKTSKSDILIVDNSKGKRYFNLIKNKYGFEIIKTKNYKNEPLKSLAKARESLYEYAKENNYDFLFSIEQDIFPPKDIIKKLLAIRKKINMESVIGAPYRLRRITQEMPPYIEKEFLTSISDKRIYSRYMKRKVQSVLTEKSLGRKKKRFQVHACGFGCTLIDVSVLKKIDVQYSDKDQKPDDAFFFIDCEKLKIPVYTDPTLLDEIIHIPGSSLAQISWGR